MPLYVAGGWHDENGVNKCKFIFFMYVDVVIFCVLLLMITFKSRKGKFVVEYSLLW